MDTINKGPKTHPWWTPVVITANSDFLLSYIPYCLYHILSPASTGSVILFQPAAIAPTTTYDDLPYPSSIGDNPINHYGWIF